MDLEIDPLKYPHLQSLTLEEILTAADRWQALQSAPSVESVLSEGFRVEEQMEMPAARRLMILLKTEVATNTDDGINESFKRSALSKLTDFADLMRAAKIEDSLA